MYFLAPPAAPSAASACIKADGEVVPMPSELGIYTSGVVPPPVGIANARLVVAFARARSYVEPLPYANRPLPVSPPICPLPLLLITPWEGVPEAGT